MSHRDITMRHWHFVMIDTPDMEHKSAAIQDQGNDVDNSTKLEDAKKSNQ